MDASGGLSFKVKDGVDAAARLKDVLSVAKSIDVPPKVMFAVGGW